jgi:hypothetical protein
MPTRRSTGTKSKPVPRGARARKPRPATRLTPAEFAEFQARSASVNQAVVAARMAQESFSAWMRSLRDKYGIETRFVDIDVRNGDLYPREEPRG